MPTTRTANVEWAGGLTDGTGTIVSTTSGTIGPLEVTWAARQDAASGLVSPEELLAAAHASCYAMALSSGLAKGGFEIEKLEISAAVTFEPGVGVTGSELTVRGKVGADDAQFRELAEAAKVNCPVSKALAAIEITLVLPDLQEAAGRAG